MFVNLKLFEDTGCQSHFDFRGEARLKIADLGRTLTQIAGLSFSIDVRYFPAVLISIALANQ